MLQFSFRHSGLTAKQFQHYARRLQKYLDFLRSVSKRRTYDIPETAMNACDDRAIVKEVTRSAQSLVGVHPLVVVVGIGGSNLGTQAVYHSIRGQGLEVRDQNVGELVFADTVDSYKLSRIINKIWVAHRQKRRVILDIISKSGGTTETIINAEALLKHAGPWKKQDVVVTTDEGSPLWKLATSIGYSLFSIPSVVGGRDSVFTAVGLFPLAVAGLDVRRLLKGARWSRSLCLTSPSPSPAVKSASMLYHYATHGKIINDNFFFRTDLESLGKWYRQLMGEGIGKDGKGVTPTVSIGSTDLHSMVQLTLGGPQDKTTTFVSVRDPLSLRLPKKTILGAVVDGVIDGRSSDEVLNAILRGTQAAYARKKHPFIDVVFDRLDEESLGAFMQWKMIEMMMLGKLFGVNAFDQPNVEEYKVATKKLLVRKE